MAVSEEVAVSEAEEEEASAAAAPPADGEWFSHELHECSNLNETELFNSAK